MPSPCSKATSVACAMPWPQSTSPSPGSLKRSSMPWKIGMSCSSSALRLPSGVPKPMAPASSSSRSRSACSSTAAVSMYQTITTGALWICQPAIGAWMAFSVSSGARSRNTTTARRLCTLPQCEAMRAASSMRWIFSGSTGRAGFRNRIERRRPMTS